MEVTSLRIFNLLSLIARGVVCFTIRGFYLNFYKQKKSSQSNIPVLRSDGNLVSEPTEVAEALNSQYTSQFTREPGGHLPGIDG